MDGRPVLLIDNDSAWCERVCRFLEARGLQVIAAPTEAEALGAIGPWAAPAAVLVDPTACGQVLGALRTRFETDAVPVFIVSSASAGAVYRKNEGVQGYMRKSVALDHLLLLLDGGSTSGVPHGAAQGRAA